MALGPMPNRLRWRTSILAVTTRGQPSGLNLAWTRWREGEAAAVEQVGGLWLETVAGDRARPCGCAGRENGECVAGAARLTFLTKRSEGVEHVMALEMESLHVLVSFDLAECRSAEGQKKSGSYPIFSFIAVATKYGLYYFALL